MSENNSIHLFVFSFNRGQFLNNCILSVKKCAAEVPLTVIDDCSNDPNTLLVLEKLRKNYEVISNDKTHQKEKKTGGLAGSMNQAMEIASSRNVQYAFFLQDDMQFVRTMRDIDLANVEKYFELIENTFQISTNFIRQVSSDAYLSKNGIVAGGRAYVRRDEIAKGKSYFSDTGIFDVKRFEDYFGHFDIGEDRNSERAKSRGLVCGRAVYPLTCWCPYPISFRGKKRLLVHNAIENLGGAGLHPIKIMDLDDEERFLARGPEELPIMEKFLSAPSAPRHDVWSTGGGEYNLLARGGFPAAGFRFLRATKRAFSGEGQK